MAQSVHLVALLVVVVVRSVIFPAQVLWAQLELSGPVALVLTHQLV
jgi:hypothetical protein